MHEISIEFVLEIPLGLAQGLHECAYLPSVVSFNYWYNSMVDELKGRGLSQSEIRFIALSIADDGPEAVEGAVTTLGPIVFV